MFTLEPIPENVVVIDIETSKRPFGLPVCLSPLNIKTHQVTEIFAIPLHPGVDNGMAYSRSYNLSSQKRFPTVKTEKGAPSLISLVHVGPD